VKVKNNLRILMAKHDVKSVRELSKATDLHYGTLLNFYHQRFEVFNVKVVASLCEYFECEIQDLLEIIKEKAS
jgi:putative transcriptional regulator